ncbi:hypothetical protein [uncultured Microbacterium sp.]|mgnify:CR=1 FL=1|uniref:hypothetical protein n=1 Tax=uncultured Microbacterium sp. TaxID=191216 RepID=UPI00095FE3A6|nr:hypothetical protein [uncultured Microbacterium sp.]MBN9141084.1 hypothetical protein [Micrococcales bacterium]OJX69724.1 MAG: hypothetical protein BGO94_14725 [Micrococcales bacterium 72-143]
MTDNLIQFEAGDVLANLEARTISGLLLPFNEEGRTNVGRFQVQASAVAIPADPAVVGLNIGHERSHPVGRAVKLEQRKGGIFATFQIAKTPEGDQALAAALNGTRRKLSAEFGPAFIKAGKLVAGHAKLWGAALVEAGAFPSAQVLAADTPDEEVPASDPYTSPEASSSSQYVTEFTDTDGVKWRRIEENTSTTTIEKVTETPESAPDEETPNESETEVTASAAGVQTPAIPQTVLASAPQTPATTTPRPVDLRQVFASIAAVKADPGDQENTQVLAALTDIKISGANALPTTDVLRPNWVGQMYDGIPYEREYINLGNLGTDISAAGKKGFKVKRGTTGSPIPSPAGIPNGGDWAGNKTEINSYNGFTQTAVSALRRFAVGHDIAREFYDLPGGAEVVEAFLKLVLEDHLYWSDMWALFDLQSAAGIPIAAGTYPTDYPAALGQLIQGILAVKARKADGRRDVPTFAIANDEAYAQLVYAAGGEQHLPAFVKIAISTNSSGTVDGDIQVVQGDTGITGSPSVIVGAKRAVEFDELAGGPLIVNALELAKGGIDRAVHGYLQTFPVRDEAVVIIGTAPNRANSTAYDRGDLLKRGSNTYRVVVAGTTAGSAPTEPAAGETVGDGTATLLRLA